MPASPAPAPWRLVSRSEAETLALARAFGRRARPGHVFALAGPLGAGKTVFARGLAEGLGVDEPVVSPTFTLMHRYQGRHPVLHVDAYRLSGLDELDDLDLDTDLLDAAVVVEWGEGVAERLSEDDHLLIRLERREDDTRSAVLEPYGADWAERARRLVGS